MLLSLITSSWGIKKIRGFVNRLVKRSSYYVMQFYARHAKPVPPRHEQSNGALDLFAGASLDGSRFASSPSIRERSRSNFLIALTASLGRSARASAEVLEDTLDAR